MGKALYRKHRPKKLADVVGQEHITTTLENALKKGSISHAYLFTGPRGVGKTSIARILAHEVNDLPYDEDANHLDIIEIDAASNRRIDEIRTLRERIHNAPASAKYKVYIIDEVHMLTKEAFNALLKTLEEPPAHAIFVLATTEAHKLPETIISRTQRFTFKPVEQSAVVAHLRHIAEEEGITINDEALQLIAEHGGGSFRDSISLLDQLGSSGAVVDLAAAQQALGIAPSRAIDELFDTLVGGNTGQLIEQLTRFHEQGYQAAQIARQLASRLREGLLSNNLRLPRDTVTRLLGKLIDVPASHDPTALLEIVLLDVTLAQEPSNTASQTPTKPAGSKPAEKTGKKDKQEPPAAKPEPKPVANKTNPSPLDQTAWDAVLQTLKQKHNSLYSVVRMATPSFHDNTLTLAFAFPFHQKRLSDSKNKQLLTDLLGRQTSQTIIVESVVDKRPTAAKEKEPPIDKQPPAKDPLQTISNIFGDAEVLE